MADQSIAAGHPTETWAALIGSVTAVVALIGVLYSRINDDIKSHATKLQSHETNQDTKFAEFDKKLDVKLKELEAKYDGKLDRGVTAFSEIGKKLVAIGEKITALEEEDAFESQELDRICLDIKDLEKRLLTIEVEHKGCQERLKGLKL